MFSLNFCIASIMWTVDVTVVNNITLLPKAKRRPPKFKKCQLFCYANVSSGVNVRLNMYSPRKENKITHWRQRLVLSQLSYENVVFRLYYQILRKLLFKYVYEECMVVSSQISMRWVKSIVSNDYILTLSVNSVSNFICPSEFFRAIMFLC